MKLTEEQKRKVQNGILSKFKEVKCPFCGNTTSFPLKDELYHIVAINEKLEISTEKIINCIVLRCHKCGHVELFDYELLSGDLESSK